MKEKKETSPLYFFLGITLIIAYQGILPIIYFKIFKEWATSPNFWLSNLTYVGYYLLVVLGLILMFHKSLKKEWKNFFKNRKNYSKLSMKTWAKGFGLTILANLIVLMITGGAISGNEAQNREVLKILPLYAGVIMCFIGPFIEELVFRKSFKKAFKNKYLFAIITSLIFASLHVINSFDPLTIESFMANWKQIFFLLPYSTLAFFFALSYYETDNIFVSTLAHCFHNTLTLLIIIISGMVGL